MILVQLLVLVLLSATTSARDLRIGAFNIQIFGVTKAKNPVVMDILIKIIRRYDLLLIQEIRDSSQTAIHKLLSRVNEKQSEPFDMVLSERLGRSHSKEQYAYFYRPAAGLQVKDAYVYSDTKIIGGLPVDLFERQPYVVHFSSSKTQLGAFGLIGIHVDPDKAVEELNYLQEYVFDDVRKKLDMSNLMLLGDLNADCGYVSKTKMAALSMRTSKRYNWLIGDDVDTTVKRSHCAYDRFITTGPDWDNGIVPKSATVYRFDLDPSIGPIDNALASDVSDHYPIEFLLAEKQFIIILITNNVFIKLAGAYTTSGSLPPDLYQLKAYSQTDVVLSVYKSENGQMVGELNSETEDEKDLTNALLSLLRNTSNLKIKMYIEPFKKRYRDKQRSKLLVAVPATDEQRAIAIWNNINTVCQRTYFKCSKDSS